MSSRPYISETTNNPGAPVKTASQKTEKKNIIASQVAPHLEGISSPRPMSRSHGT